jgi:hypothetical protein
VELGLLTESLLAEASWTRQGCSTYFKCATSSNTTNLYKNVSTCMYVCWFTYLFLLHFHAVAPIWLKFGMVIENVPAVILQARKPFPRPK